MFVSALHRSTNKFFFCSKSKVDSTESGKRSVSRFRHRSATRRNPAFAVCLHSESEKKPKGGWVQVDKTTKLLGCFDVAIIGAGPAGLSLAAAISERNQQMAGLEDGSRVSVVVIDPDFRRRWLPNYGVWLDEIENLGIDDCLAATWPRVSSYLPEKVTKSRAYGRIDRVRLKQHFLNLCLHENSGVELLEGFVNRQRAENGTLQVSPAKEVVNKNDAPAALHCIHAKLVIDTSGHTTALVEYDKPHNPAYQAAYGIEAQVVSHPFAHDEMVLMDYRKPTTVAPSDRDNGKMESIPTFLYAMPLSDTRIFLEETSLVGRPPVPFDFLKQRLYARLETLNILVTRVDEEEFCLIPMGGALPKLDQTVLGFGGSGGLVHPSTGYMISRTLNLAHQLADAIVCNGQRSAKDLWQHTIWTEQRRSQRDFYVFGGDVLLNMSLTELQEFFRAFFELPNKDWSDFLSFRQFNGKDRLRFGLLVWWHTSLRVKQKLLLAGVQEFPILLRSILS